MKRTVNINRIIAAAIATYFPTFGPGKSLGTERGSIVPGRVTAPTFWQCTGNAGSYGAAIIGTKKYRAWKRKQNRRYRNANGGK